MAATRRITLASLTAETLREVLVRLPVDSRARAAAVCRAWRDVLEDSSLWTRLDLSHTSGVEFDALTDAVLQSAAAKARGGLTVLDARHPYSVLSNGALLEVVVANSTTLTDLSCELCFSGEELEALLRAAPSLRECHSSLKVSGLAVGRMLRNEPPFGSLRMNNMLVVNEPWPSDEAAMHSFATQLGAHPLTLSQVSVLAVNSPPPFEDGAFDALVDVVLARRLDTFIIHNLQSAIPASSLARLLGSESLAKLEVTGSLGNEMLLFSGLQNAEPLLTAALRLNDKLCHLELAATGIFSDAAAAEALIRALTAHPTIREISLCNTPVAGADRARIGASLGVLVAANAPRLIFLDLSGCDLGDEGLGPPVDALKVNSKLGSLYCYGNNISETFARKQLLPAVFTNTGLYSIIAVSDSDDVGTAAALGMVDELVNLQVKARLYKQ